MNNGKACAIFSHIESDLYSDYEKAEAIHTVLNMETHNGITKISLLGVLRWLLPEKTKESEEPHA